MTHHIGAPPGSRLHRRAGATSLSPGPLPSKNHWAPSSQSSEYSEEEGQCPANTVSPSLATNMLSSSINSISFFSRFLISFHAIPIAPTSAPIAAATRVIAIGVFGRTRFGIAAATPTQAARIAALNSVTTSCQLSRHFSMTVATLRTFAPNSAPAFPCKSVYALYALAPIPLQYCSCLPSS